MASLSDFAAKGKVLRIEGDAVVFAPSGTTYELLLKGAYSGPLNVPVSILIRAEARKIFTLPTGGNFVAPIFGPPKVLQGRVRAVSPADNTVVVQAGVPVLLKLPPDDTAIDLNNGAISTRTMLNATVMPGARFELAPATAAIGV